MFPSSPLPMERVRTMTMNWDGLKDDDDDDHFFESFDRISSAVPLDLEPSSSDDDGFDDCRMSFASAVSSVYSNDFARNFSDSSSSSASSAAASANYDVWMAAPGSIKERRKRLLQGMGLAVDKDLLRLTSAVAKPDDTRDNTTSSDVDHKQDTSTSSSSSPSPSPYPILLVRSRSDGDIETFSVDKQRKQDMIGSISKQRLTRTYSTILAPRARICPYANSIRVSPRDQTALGRSIKHSGALSSMLSTNRFGAFFLIKNLDTGKEFIVNEYGEDGMWNRLSDLQTGKQLTMEEFEKCVGYSPVVKELMRRENISRISSGVGGSDRKVASSHSYITRSLRMSKRRGVALLKNGIKGVANSMSGFICEKEREAQPPPLPPAGTATEHKAGKNSSSNSSGWIKVRQSGKSYKELSALHLCQEIQAHEGSIWCIKFNMDGRFLASAGEDRIVRVWEVQECEVMSLREEGNVTTPIHPSFCPSPERSQSLADASVMLSEKKKKGKGTSGRRGGIPDYVHVPETVFALSDKPICSFKGHLDDVLDLSWSRNQLLLSSSMDKTVRLWDLESKSCLKLFAHNDYVTCIQFNPMNDDYFISGSLDAKVRIWSIPDRQVVDWTDLHEMVTAACYTPDGQGAFIGSHKGSCRVYSAEDCKLSQTSQVDFQTKKKSHAKKITGFQFSPTNPCEVLVTSADSRIRILDGPNPVHKFKGFRNTSSQISASFSQEGKYVVCASEDSQVYVWRHEEARSSSGSSGRRSVLNTRSYEHFQCRDVSVAIPWPGTIKGEPPSLPPLNSKRHSKRLTSQSQPPSAPDSPTREDASAAATNNSKRQLPPLPKKGAAAEEELGEVDRTECGGVGESFNSEGGGATSVRYGGDSACISAAATPSSSWSSSWSWFDIGGGHGSHSMQATAWGMVIVTAGLDGEIRAYQNFGLPRRVGRQTSLFGGQT
ncbi:Guanine nucleotide-binding protein, beta subunit [Trema orientale]|uniref:Guanine nucleotide-binding protein, beta subunit n=1 Tax=Trema orientale TaxID=63057 RepID=A0A2P5DS59_TREOI|nr:Guanine nucleotide-binding protein, beta subunit [Trema orientale]